MSGAQSQLPSPGSNLEPAGHSGVSLEVERRRALVAEFVLRGLTSPVKIAQGLKRKYSIDVSPNAVRMDINKLREEWVSHRLSALQETIAMELMKLGQIEAEAWDAWEQSKSDQVEEEITEIGVISGDQQITSQTKTRTTNRDGNPRFFDVLKWVTDKRQSLLGLGDKSPNPGDPGGFRPSESIGKLSDEELAEVMDRALQRRQS